MDEKKGRYDIKIPAWVLVVGLLVVDNVVVNVCKTISVNKLTKSTKKEES